MTPKNWCRKPSDNFELSREDHFAKTKKEFSPKSIMDLDADWIEEFNNEEKAYEGFYNKPVENIRIVFLYINGKNELISSKKPLKNFRMIILCKDHPN